MNVWLLAVETSDASGEQGDNKAHFNYQKAQRSTTDTNVRETQVYDNKFLPLVSNFPFKLLFLLHLLFV